MNNFEELQKQFKQMNRLQLLEFIEKVNNAFKNPFPEGTGQSYFGAKDCYESLKREIYE